MKLVIGYLFHSEALQADGLNNTTDIAASAAVFIGLRISQKPPDEDHPYGHFRAETVASLIASIIMMLVGMQVLFSAAHPFFPLKRNTGYDSRLTAAGSAVVMLMVYRYTKGLAKR